MKPAIRELLLNKRIKFTYRSIPKDFWKRFGYETRDGISELLSGLPTTTFRINDDDSLYIEYIVPAIQKPKYSDDFAFCHSIHYQADLLTFEDGSEITQEIRQEILHGTLNVAVTPKWQAGDLIMIDNSRVMHGRNAFDDSERCVYVRIARYIKDFDN